MIAGMYEEDFMAYIIFGILLNFIFSIMFGIYLTNNIGIGEMMESTGDKEQSTLIALSIFVPYLKMIITLYRVAVLQIFFLNKGYTHKEFWIYLTHKRENNS